MKSFRIKLTKCFEGESIRITSVGKCTMDEKGRIKGFLKNYSEENPELKKVIL